MTQTNPLISIVIPLYNESANLVLVHDGLRKILAQLADQYDFQVIYVNDGSADGSLEIVQGFADKNKAVHVLSLSRNFGKEIATTAGLHEAHGDAIITLDADGQMPVELIPEFIDRWQAGAKVVIGVRTSNQGEGFRKRVGSKIFYNVINRLSHTHLVPGSSDYRLIDKVVQQEFMRMTERNRITRGLIDWLGYERDYVPFVANPRLGGEAGYSITRLIKLFVDSVISLSLSPLYIAAYLGAFVLPVSVLLFVVMVFDKVFGDPLHLNLNGGAFVIVFMLFLIGVLLMSQGIIGLYLSHIHSETQNRPLYVIDRPNSKGLSDAS